MNGVIKIKLLSYLSHLIVRREELESTDAPKEWSHHYDNMIKDVQKEIDELQDIIKNL